MKSLTTFNMSDEQTLSLSGDWTIDQVSCLESQLKNFKKFPPTLKVIDASHVEHLDSAGAYLLQEFIERLQLRGYEAQLVGLNEKQQSVFDFVFSQKEKTKTQIVTRPMPGFLYKLGEWAVDKVNQLITFLAFIGELAVIMGRNLNNWKRFYPRSILSTVQSAGFEALPIVALMAFLIGVVLAYQLAEQLRWYGADIYIVDVSGIAMLREFGPLITAIIIAGRTSTSFAAQIGTMKVNEEIDALRTMGVTPAERLVLPRILGLLIALPLLVVWADLFGVLGSMFMTRNMMGLGFYAFLERFQYAVMPKHYILGLVKAPVFAIIIAAVGCFQGFQVTLSAESVGQKTTRAAVQAIFLIIVTDAAFSVLFSEMGY